MSSNPVVIKAEGIGKKYILRHAGTSSSPGARVLRRFGGRKEDFWALKNIGFEIRKGEKVGIIGKNGAGKSTLLKLLSRITEPTEGRIELLGKVSAMLEVGTGFNPELTGRENVYLNGAILGMTKAETDAKFDRIVAFSEIGRFIDTPVKRYSSGMFVRLAFAVASHLDPDILIVDEVLAVGDQKFRQKCLDRMNEIAAADNTILCVSHQMNVIRDLCDRVIVLQDGAVVYDGDVEGGIRRYNEGEGAVETGRYTFESASRPEFIKRDATLLSFEALNALVRRNGEDVPLTFCLTWQGEKDLNEVKFRVMVRYADGTPVGIALPDKSFHCIKGETYVHTVSFDTRPLFPGKYTVSLALYQSDAAGNYEYLDLVDNTVGFEVTEPKGFDKSRIYNHIYWGHTWLPDLTIID